MAPLFNFEFSRFLIQVGGLDPFENRGLGGALDEQGFLLEEGYLGFVNDMDWGYLDPPNRPIPLSSIFDTGRMTLLQGEYGSGKSWAIEWLAKTLTPTEERWRLRLGRDDSDAIDIVDDIKDAIEGSASPPGLERPWRLVIDGLDETDIASRIIRRIHLLGENIQVVMAGRPYAFSADIRARLRRYFGEHEIAVLMLAPLRRSDIRLAARSSGVDPDAFLRVLSQHRLIHLATKPLTLAGILNRFKEGRIPANRWEAFEMECRALLREHDRTVDFPEDLRFQVGTTMAAIMRLSGRDVIHMGEGDIPPRPGIRLAQVSGGEGVTISTIKSVLGTGLFRHQGDERSEWEQPSLLDFMAAVHLQKLNLPRRALRQLLMNRSAGDEVLPPPLIGVARWLASCNRDIAQIMLRQDPIALLDSADILSNETRLRLVDRLFCADLQPWWQKLRWDLSHSKNLAYLACPGLADRLRPMLQNADIAARLLALDIACQAQPIDLGPDLEAIATNPSRTPEERILAVSFWFGHEDVPCSLLGILEEGNLNDELRGAVLRATWSQHLNKPEVFKYLPQIRKRDEGSQLREFFSQDLLPFVAQCSLEVIEPNKIVFLNEAAAWLMTDPERWVGQRASRFEDLETVILSSILLRLEHLNLPPTFTQFLESWLKSGRRFLDERSWRGHCYQFATQAGFYAQLAARPATRHAAIRYLLAAEAATTPYHLLRLGFLAPDEADVLVFLDQLAGIPAERGVEFAGYLPALFDASDPIPDSSVHLKKMVESWQAAGGDLQIATAVVAAIQRREEARMTEHDTPDPPTPERQRLEPTISEQIQSLVDTGNLSPDVWDKVAYLLAFNEFGESSDEGNKDRRFSLDVTAGPSWGALPPDLRERLIEIAMLYLREATIGYRFTIEQFNTLARIKALVLIQKLEPGCLGDVLEFVWGEIIPESLAATVWSEVSPSLPLLRDLVDEAARRAPGPVSDALLALIDHESDNILPQYLRFVAPSVSEVAGPKLLTFLRERGWPGIGSAGPEEISEHQQIAPSKISAIVGAFAEFVPAIKNWALEAALADIWSKAEHGALAAICLEKDPILAWQSVFHRMRADEGFAEQVLRHGYSWRETDAWWVLLKLEQLEEFLQWLIGKFPPDTDPIHRGVFSPNFRDEMVSLRSNVFRHLMAWEDPAATTAMERLATQFPQYAHLRVAVAEMQERDRIASWEPPDTGEIVRLLDDPSARMIRSNDELLAVVMDCLDDLGRELHADGMLPLLYGTDGNGNPDQSKLLREEHISALIAHELRQRLERLGAGIHREVQVNRANRTDLWIQVANQGQRREPRNLIIEAKKASNEEIRTALPNQLIERYMKPRGVTHGVYLIFQDRELGTIEATLQGQVEVARAEGINVAVHVIDIRNP